MSSHPKTGFRARSIRAVPAALQAAFRTARGAALCTAIVLAAGCTAIRPDAPALYDLGPTTQAVQGTPLAGRSISVAEVRVPAWLDTQLMYYRLDYAHAQQSRPYAGSRWAMPPGELLTQRVRQRIADAGGIVLSASYGAPGVPLLRIQLDEFSQHFPAQGTSDARLAMRATLFNGGKVVAQRTFTQQVNAPSGDAEGGARALAQASDSAVAELINWLTALPQ